MTWKFQPRIAGLALAALPVLAIAAARPGPGCWRGAAWFLHPAPFLVRALLSDAAACRPSLK